MAEGDCVVVARPVVRPDASVNVVLERVAEAVDRACPTRRPEASSNRVWVPCPALRVVARPVTRPEASVTTKRVVAPTTVDRTVPLDRADASRSRVWMVVEPEVSAVPAGRPDASDMADRDGDGGGTPMRIMELEGGLGRACRVTAASARMPSAGIRVRWRSAFMVGRRGQPRGAGGIQPGKGARVMDDFRRSPGPRARRQGRGRWRGATRRPRCGGMARGSPPRRPAPRRG